MKLNTKQSNVYSYSKNGLLLIYKLGYKLPYCIFEIIDHIVIESDGQYQNKHLKKMVFVYEN